MRAKGTVVFLFFVASAIIVATVFNLATRDIFSWLHVNNGTILGESFRLSTLIGCAIALILALFFGVFYTPSRQFIDQCIAEFDKIAFPEWKETKVATFTVVLVSVVASIILGLFDLVFSWWTSNNLFIFL
jgi:preprotein translocase subunit SecE